MSRPMDTLAIQKVVGRNVLRLIEDRRMSFGDAARATGLSKTAIYQIADGVTDPRLSSLCAIATCFGVPLWTLLETDQPEDGTP